MHAIVISIGDELVLGQTIDSNSAYLSAELARQGIATLYHQTVGDDRAATRDAIVRAAEAAPLVLVTGGLGPTEDDLTRPALADALNAPLVEDPGSVEAIKAYFAARGRTPTSNNLLQALHPQGTTVIENTCGTAPGIRSQLGRAAIFVTPGVPGEMRAMFTRSIVPYLNEQASPMLSDSAAPCKHGVILTASVHTFGQGESLVAQTLGALMQRERNPRVGTTVSEGIISVRVRSEFADAKQAQAQLHATVDEIEQRLGAIVFGRDGRTLQEAVIALLHERALTLATAESCTGGLLGAMLTEVAGSSAVYAGGWITYANQMKAEQLDVNPALIAQHGAVSEPVARAMARGAVLTGHADMGISITGVAGPTGGTKEKPVGTVWVAVAQRQGANAKSVTTQAMLMNLPGDRPAVRDRSAKCAMQMLRFLLLDVPLETLMWGRVAAAATV